MNAVGRPRSTPRGRAALWEVISPRGADYQVLILVAAKMIDRCCVKCDVAVEAEDVVALSAQRFLRKPCQSSDPPDVTQCPYRDKVARKSSPVEVEFRRGSRSERGSGGGTENRKNCSCPCATRTCMRRFMCGTVRNVARELCRKRGRETTAEGLILTLPDNTVEDPVSRLVREDRERKVRQAIGKLPPPRREIAERVLIRGERARKVGEDLGISEKTVRRHRELAQADLRRALENERPRMG